ncbi:hypothetical protein GOBAR_DD03613 [Gossypium barbadense]|nr:hypothetical protein GOBAR_DD03613 [Gossypium barbadense]
MTGKAVTPNTYTYTALISSLCRANMMVEAVRLFGQMVERNIMPNDVTYNVLIEGYCKDGNMLKAFELFGEMVDKECRKPKSSWMVFIEITEMDDQGLSPDNVIYTSMIDANSKVENLKEAFELWDIMIGEGCIPNVVKYTALIPMLN